MAEDLQKLKGILKNINEKEKSKDFCKKINSNSDLSDEENEKSESVETLEKLKKMIRKPENDFVSELKGVLKQPAFEKKLSPRSKEILSEEKESVVGKNGIGLNGDNSVVTLHRVGRGDYVEKSFNKQKDENSPGSRGPPKYLQNEGIARRINNSRSVYFSYFARLCRQP